MLNSMLPNVTSAVRVKTTKLGVVIKVFVFLGLLKTVSLFSLPSVVMVVLPKDGNLKAIPESQLTLTTLGREKRETVFLTALGTQTP